MTKHIRFEEVASTPIETSRYLLGMPHLCPNGLSENWLWKELGHRHWGLIADAIGKTAIGFGTEAQQPIYAAFRRLALRSGCLNVVQENDTLDIGSTLTHLSATRVESHHIVAHRDRLVADVEMTSVFVRRQTSGLNRSIVRVQVDATKRFSSVGDRAAAPPGRHGDGRCADGAKLGEIDVGTLVVEPCPQLDFNGAGLLYFSSFIAAVDRAEWHLVGKEKPLRATTERSAVFHSNIDIGDDLSIRILAAPGEAAYQHRSLISATSDGRLVAEIITQKAQ